MTYGLWIRTFVYSDSHYGMGDNSTCGGSIHGNSSNKRFASRSCDRSWRFSHADWLLFLQSTYEKLISTIFFFSRQLCRFFFLVSYSIADFDRSAVTFLAVTMKEVLIFSLMTYNMNFIFNSRQKKNKLKKT